MVSAADITREQDAGLKRLYERGLELALKMQDDAMAAATANERARLGAAFHRISRGVRQTAALRVKLAADATRGEREQAAEVVRLETARVARRKDQVTATVQRLIWTEAESDDSREDLKADLEDLLDIEALDEAFPNEALDLQVARICETLGLSLTLPIHGEGGPSAEERMVGGAGFCSAAAPSTTPSAGRGPPPPSMGEEEDWRSSA
ncbi:MAG: hypothetical protein JWP50_741 [Phenylobacterium sp.]|nr:hypothetical protein [Phenylobacterium sp.]